MATIKVGSKVEAGANGTEDYDTGVVHEIGDEEVLQGGMHGGEGPVRTVTIAVARVGWDSGVETREAVSSLRAI